MKKKLNDFQGYHLRIFRKFRMGITSILEWTSKTGQHLKWFPRRQKELFWFRCLITQESQKNPEAWLVNFFAKMPTLFKIREISMKMEIRSVQFKPSEYFCTYFSKLRIFILKKFQWNGIWSYWETLSSRRLLLGHFWKRCSPLDGKPLKIDFEDIYIFRNIQDLKKKVYFACGSCLFYQIKTFKQWNCPWYLIL